MVSRSAKKLITDAAGITKRDDKPIYTADFDGLIDLVEHEGEVCFLTTDLEIKPEAVIDDKVFLPPPKESLQYLIPSAGDVLSEIAKHAESDCQEDLAIYNDLFDYHINISELPDRDYY